MRQVTQSPVRHIRCACKREIEIKRCALCWCLGDRGLGDRARWMVVASPSRRALVLLGFRCVLSREASFIPKRLADCQGSLGLGARLKAFGLDDIERDLAALSSEASVERCVDAGRPCLTNLFLATYAYALAAAARWGVEQTPAPEELVRLHMAARSLEVLFPRAGSLMPCLVAAHREVTGRLRSRIFSAPWGSREPGSTSSVTIVLTVVGSEVGRAAQATLRSLLWHASCPIRVLTIGDAEGCSGFQQAASSARTSFEDRSAALAGAAWAHIRSRLPNRCFDAAAAKLRPLQNTSLVDALLARLFLHELLPDVDRAISLDIGDLVVLGDLCRLWRLVEWFSPSQAVAAAWESGPLQVAFGPLTGDHGASRFWARRGLPRLTKGMNTGLLLWDLQRLRTLDVNGSTWTSAMIQAAGESASSWCGVDRIWEQAVLNTFAFKGGDAHVYELSSKWNYIPTVAWELATHDASAAGLPEEALASKLHPGLRHGGRLVHACPSYGELVGEWGATSESPEELARWARHAREYRLWFSHGAPGLYTQDLRCDAEVLVVHFAGHAKRLPWAREALNFWGGA